MRAARKGQQRRRAATSPGRRRAACAPVAQVHRTIDPDGRAGRHHALRSARCRPSAPPPAARAPPRPPRAEGVRAGRRAAASMSRIILHRVADAQPARPWRGCAGRYFRVPGCPRWVANALRAARSPPARSGARRPRSVAATAGARMRMRKSGPVTGMPTRGLHALPAWRAACEGHSDSRGPGNTLAAREC
jgi:hypothetical protein